MMISCQKAADLVCQRLDRRLSVWERFQLRFHLLMCRVCRKFEQQTESLDRAIRTHFAETSRQELEGLSQEACGRLEQRLRDAMAARDGRSDTE